jgi:predicted nucleotide-binding protein
MSSQFAEIERFLHETRSLLDDPHAPLAPILRRATMVATLLGDAEHRDLFLLHLDGIPDSKSPGPRHAPWKNPEWKPRWDVREVFLTDRATPLGDEAPEDVVMTYPLEQLEWVLASMHEDRIQAEARGRPTDKLFELEMNGNNILFRIRRRVETFLHLAEASLVAQKEAEIKETPAHAMGGAIFIGYGQSTLWRDLKELISERLGLAVIEFNSQPVAGKTTVERLSEMLDASSFAFLVLTAEDEHADQTIHARENVIHEVGLFQGRLSFSRAIVMIEEGCAEFSNIFGLNQIRFPKGNILAKSEEIRGVLEREQMISTTGDETSRQNRSQEDPS